MIMEDTSSHFSPCPFSHFGPFMYKGKEDDHILLPTALGPLYNGLIWSLLL